MARTVAGAAPGRMNRRFFIVALLLAVLSAVLVYAKISSGGNADESSSAPGEQQVVVTRTAIKQNVELVTQDLLVKSVPLSAKTEGAFATLEDAVGKITKFPLAANEQVIASSVIDLSQPGGANLRFVVPEGRRGIAINASQVIGAGGLILPGDYVDVIWTCCEDVAVASRTILKNVQVAAVAQGIVSSGPVDETTGDSGSTSDGDDPVAAESSKPDPEAITLTLLLTPAEAQMVFLAEESGVLRADLRGVNDEEQIDPGFTLITDLLPADVVARLLEGLKPEGYRATQ